MRVEQPVIDSDIRRMVVDALNIQQLDFQDDGLLLFFIASSKEGKTGDDRTIALPIQ